MPRLALRPLILVCVIFCASSPQGIGAAVWKEEKRMGIDMKQAVSRRQFAAGTLAASALATLAGCSGGTGAGSAPSGSSSSDKVFRCYLSEPAYIDPNKCKECGGEGIVYGEEVVTVKIPQGVSEGMQLSMSGKGNAGKHNGVPGDLLILIEEEADKELIRDENDLIYNLLLSFPTAALGGTVEIPTIDGRVKVKIEPGTQPGKVLRLRNKGLPSVNGYGTGDLLVNVSIYVPETLNKDEKKALEEMDKSDNFKPNTSIKEKIFRKFKTLFE